VNLTGCGEWFGSSGVEIRAIETMSLAEEDEVEHAAIQNINAFIEAGLATAGTNRK
jgi:hypothetical protein